MAIGARANASSFYDGKVDNCLLWARDIRSDLATIYNGGNGISHADIVGSGGPVASTTDGKILIRPVGFA